MAFINSTALDQGLNYINANGARLDICSAEPTTYAQATSTLTLANKAGLAVGAAEAGGVDGRRVVIPAITDGSVTGTGTGTHFALTDGVGVLLATGILTASQGLTALNNFTLDAININFRAPVSV